MKAYWRNGLHWMEVGGQLRALAALPSGKEPQYPLDRGLVDPRAILDAVVKRKIPSPWQESNPRIPIIQPVDQGYTNINCY
jgi:hypothetical protein